MSAGEFRLPSFRSSPRSNFQTGGRSPALSARFYPPAELRRLRKSEQVAAVCYRVRGGTIEFLLVKTHGGRWIFPKGSTEPGLSGAQAAALEAFEEAGVHGRMEVTSFARYVRRKRCESNDSCAAVTAAKAYLCEVFWLDAPQELDRHPTWFPAEKAKRRLRDERAIQYANELARVIDNAVARIQRTHAGNSTFVDALQKVEFIDSARALTVNSRRKARPV